MRIAHLTSVHPRFDTRIFYKECLSLLNSGLDVTLIVADGNGDESRDGVKILDVGKAKGRFERIFLFSRRFFRKALSLNCEIYHIHDPELIPVGLLLKKFGKKVIFDSHENISQQILGKPYLNKFSSRLISSIYSLFERVTLTKFDFLIGATPPIKIKLTKFHHKVVDICNFPVLEEFARKERCGSFGNRVCYLGGISFARGAKEMILAPNFFRSDAKLTLAGPIFDHEIEKKIKENRFPKISYVGVLNRAEVNRVLSESFAGLVVLHPLINYLESFPVKMFEYMAAGLPVIASNFPLWKEILEGNGCGICVDPSRPEEIATAIDWIVEHPKESELMGRNGRSAIEKKFNWQTEEAKLLSLYKTLLIGEK